MVRTEIVGVDTRAVGGKLRIHITMQALNCGLVVKPPGNPGLVGDHDYAETRFIQKPDRLGSPGDEMKIFGPVQKLQFNIYSAVPVQEDGSVHNHETLKIRFTVPGSRLQDEL
jgi:hypothetical protein